MFRRHFFPLPPPLPFFYSTRRPTVSNKPRILRTRLWPSELTERIYTSRVVLYRVSTGCRSDITSVVLRRTRYSALVYVTEERRIGHTVAPILEVEHRWYRHRRSAAETVTDILAKHTESYAWKICRSYSAPSFQEGENTFCLSVLFFPRFNIDILSENSNYDKVQARIVRENIFIFHSAFIHTYISHRYPIARWFKRIRLYIRILLLFTTTEFYSIRFR